MINKQWLLNVLESKQQYAKEMLDKSKGLSFDKYYIGYCDMIGEILEYLKEEFETKNDDLEVVEIQDIEQISINENGTLGFPNGNWTARNMDKAFAIKINELIKAVKEIKQR